MRWEDQEVVRQDDRWVVKGHAPMTIEVAWHKSPENFPGMAYVGLRVSAPVGSATPPHRHGGAAVTGIVIRGQILSQMICQGSSPEPRIYRPGDFWYEPPGCHHVRSENVGGEDGQILAVFIIDQQSIDEKGMIGALLQFDAEVEEKEREKEQATG